MRFSAELRRLQSLPKCERLPLPSFLLLPFQRITRLRMLLQVPAELRPLRPRPEGVRGERPPLEADGLDSPLLAPDWFI